MSGQATVPDVLPDLYEASIDELQAGLTAGHFSSVDLTKAYLARIDEVNHKGPRLNAVIELNPNVLQQAAALDSERQEKGPRSPLHGIPILIKDNIALKRSTGMESTAGSYALVGSATPRHATLATKLIDSGAIILGKSNCSEWSMYRGKLPNGWSARGGQTSNPYYEHLDSSGSSSGSGVSMAIGLAAGSLGSETNGSIVSPSSYNNIVGMKPTVGLTSRAGVIPISEHQDSVGPMARSVADVAAILTVIRGPDPLDPASLSQPDGDIDYSTALRTDALQGARIGVPRAFCGDDRHAVTVFDQAVDTLRSLGAEIVDPSDIEAVEDLKSIASSLSNLVLDVEFKIGVNKYLSELEEVPTGVRSLTDLIEFNAAHADKELVKPHYTSQSRFIGANETEPNAHYRAALQRNWDVGRARGIDYALKKHSLDALVLPTNFYASTITAIAGYPIISLPLGFQPSDIPPAPANPVRSRAPGQPFGISFFGTAYTESRLIGYAYALEQEMRAAGKGRLGRKAYSAAIPKTQLKDVISQN